MKHLNFRWILRNRLAGCAMPGLFGPLDADLGVLHDHGIRRLISLTQQAVSCPPVMEIEVHHLPIPDMSPPVRQVAVRACEVLIEALEQEQPVAVHCRAGVGRTGTILGCLLILGGGSAGRAIAQLRGISSHYVQSETQVSFLEYWAERPPEDLVERIAPLKNLL